MLTGGVLKARGAALNPIHGADAVARFILGTEKRSSGAARTARPARLNGEPGFVVYVGGEAHAAVAFQISGERIRSIYSISNPEKLRGLAGLK